MHSRNSGCGGAQSPAFFQDRAFSQDLPIVIEIVDTRAMLEKFRELIDHEIEEGMATLEEVKIHFYRSGKPTSLP